MNEDRVPFLASGASLWLRCTAFPFTFTEKRTLLAANFGTLRGANFLLKLRRRFRRSAALLRRVPRISISRILCHSDRRTRTSPENAATMILLPRTRQQRSKV